MIKYFVGIDPDVDKSGVAIVETTGDVLLSKQMSFACIIELLINFTSEHKGEVKVIVEAGWKNKSNWHWNNKDSKAVVAAKGVSQGRNEQVSKLFGDFMQALNIDFEFRRPLKKMWHGKDRKITQKELENVVRTKLPRMNQEGRDAMLLAWVAAGLPISLRI